MNQSNHGTRFQTISILKSSDNSKVRFHDFRLYMSVLNYGDRQLWEIA